MKTCTVDGCSAKIRCKGVCALHYDRLRRTGVTEVPTRKVMADEPCAIKDCNRPGYSKKLCRLHARRLALHGDVQSGTPAKVMPKASERDDIVARVLSRTERTESGCLNFQGVRTQNGYGQVSWRGKQWVAHRAVWTASVGPIPDGLAPDGSKWTIDHLCSNRACVNVGHLEMVSLIENSRRGGGLAKAQAKNRGPRSAHGSVARYHYGCRCEPCKAANTDASRTYRANRRRAS